MRLRIIAVLAALMSVLALPATSQAQMWPHGHGSGPWAGFYIGVHGGYVFNDAGNNSITGPGWGLQLGHNWQFGQFVAGIEADYTRTEAQERVVVPGGFASASNNDMWSVRARLGWVLFDNLMAFGTIGYGGFDIDVICDYPGNFGPNTAGRMGPYSTTFNGVAYGGGLEWMATRNILLRGELITYHGDGNNNRTSEMGQLRFAASYKF